MNLLYWLRKQRRASESSEDFESAKGVKGACSGSEIPPGLTAETPGSFYHPSESSEDSDGAKEAKSSSRKALDAFLVRRDVSPVRHQLLTSWDSIARRTQRYHVRKARQVLITALEEIEPGNAEIPPGLTASKSSASNPPE